MTKPSVLPLTSANGNGDLGEGGGTTDGVVTIVNNDYTGLNMYQNIKI